MEAFGAFDYVIVGGGSAGCVLAHRLSAVPSLRVALIEAGADTPPGQVPEAILDSYPMPVFCGDTYIWPALKARATKQAAERVYEQGRVMGGGSSINVQSANRGLPRDYDDWAANGAAGWGWDDVLPYFRKLERDVNFPDAALLPCVRERPAKEWPCHAAGPERGIRRWCFSRRVLESRRPACDDRDRLPRCGDSQPAEPVDLREPEGRAHRDGRRHVERGAGDRGQW